MKSIHKSVTAVAILLSVSIPSFSNTTNRIMGLEKAASYNHAVKNHIYIQAGAFLNKKVATQYQKHLQNLVKVPVIIEQNQPYYRVLLGPLTSKEQVRMVGQNTLNKKYFSPKVIKKETIYLSKIETKKSVQIIGDKDSLNTPTHSNGWFVSIDGGLLKGDNAQMTVNNGSEFPSPLDRDIYTANSNKGHAFAGLTLGKRWTRDNQWLPMYSLGLRYKHLFSNSIEGQVIQYSLPEFTNYNYQWKTSSNAVLAQTKLDILRFKNLLPYISAGAGVAFNRANSYTENALSNTTPRISPQYGSNSRNQFSYNLGAGLDFQWNPNLLFSVGYEFQDWGKLNSGYGANTWSSEQLSQPNYQSNALLLSMDYWFNN